MYQFGGFTVILCNLHLISQTCVSPFSIELWIMPRDTMKLVTLVSKYNRGKWGQYMVRLQPGECLYG
jgi:hypothetical protein